MHLLQRTRSKPAGYILVTASDGRILEEYETARCCHCQLQWRIRPGSGILRGWCPLCSQPHCGRPACRSCVPFQKRLAREHAYGAFLRAVRA